jgi:hypothetical protein
MELTLIGNMLRPGERLEFGAGRSDLNLGPGWSDPEPDFCWTDSIVAQLRLMLPPTSMPPVITIDCEPKVRNDEPTPVLFALNGRIMLTEEMIGRQDIQLAVDPNTTTANLAFIVPSAITPANLLATPPDYRTLGLRVFSVRLEGQAG